MPIGVIPEQFAVQIAYGIYDYIDNPGSPYHLNRSKRPVLERLRNRRVQSPAVNGILTVKYNEDSDIDFQWFNDLDILDHEEISVGYDLIFDFRQCHMGHKVRHQKFKDAGYTIIPNANRSGKGDFTKIAKADKLRLVDLVEQEFMEVADAYDRRLDYFLHVGRTFDTDAMAGIADLVPYVIPAGGTYGSQPWTRPELQRQAEIDLATDGSVDAGQTINRLKRNAMVNNQEFGGQLDFAFAGGLAIDYWIAWCKNEGLDWQVQMNTGLQKTNMVIEDAAVVIAGLPVVHDPTLDKIAAETGDDTWSRTLHMWNTKSWELHHPPGEDKQFSAGLDPVNQRFSRYSWEGRYCLLNKNPSSNVLVTFAAPA